MFKNLLLIRYIFFYPCVTISTLASAQSVSIFLPEKISSAEKYLFYLHGGVVTDKGNNGITDAAPEWGPYEYLNILDSLKNRGYNVISENRKPEVDDSIYANKVAQQIDTLIRDGVKEKNIVIVGASAGADIAIHVSAKMKNKKLKFVIMGACWPDTYKGYEPLRLYGHFLSIIESSDPHGTCAAVFKGRKNITIREITLHTGLSHGFIFKGYKEWIDPIVGF